MPAAAMETPNPRNAPIGFVAISALLAMGLALMIPFVPNGWNPNHALQFLVLVFLGAGFLARIYARTAPVVGSVFLAMFAPLTVLTVWIALVRLAPIGQMGQAWANGKYIFISIVFWSALFASASDRLQEKICSRKIPVKFLVFLAASIMATYWILAGFFAFSTRINGIRYWCLDDDSMISMTFAKRLARGQGFTWANGQRIEGFTNPLLTLAMAALHLLPISPQHISAILVFGGLLTAFFCAWLLYKLAASYASNANAKYWAVIIILVSPFYFLWALRGCEEVYMAFCLLVFMGLLQKDFQRGKSSWTVGIVLGVLSIIRSDAIVLSLPFGLMYSYGLKWNRKAILNACLGVTPWLLYLAFRIGYFHQFFPNTAILKLEHWPMRPIAGLQSLLDFFRDFGVIIVAALLVSSSTKLVHRRVWAFIIAAFLAYQVCAGGDYIPQSRFFMAIVPLLIAFACFALPPKINWPAAATLALIPAVGIGLSGAPPWDSIVLFPPMALAYYRGTRRQPRWDCPLFGLWMALSVLSAALMTPLLGLMVVPAAVTADKLAAYPLVKLRIRKSLVPALLSSSILMQIPRLIGYMPFEMDHLTKGMTEIGLLIKRNTPAATRFATFAAGAVVYFSDRSPIDMLGVCDKHIAELDAAPGENLSGHNKYDFHYSIGMLKPDIVVSSLRLPVNAHEMAQDSKGGFGFIGRLYFSPDFRRAYLNNPVNLDTYVTLFVNKDSLEKVCGRNWSPLDDSTDSPLPRQWTSDDWGFSKQEIHNLNQ